MGEVEARERAADLLAAMTFEEKVAVGLGDFEAVAHLGVPPLLLYLFLNRRIVEGLTAGAVKG